MSKRTPPVLVVLLAASLIASPVLVASPAPSGTLSGVILGDHIAGAIVHAAVDDTTIRSSAALGTDGRFAIEGLPEGVWNLAVQTEAGLHVASTPVPVHAGETKMVRISLAPGANATTEPVGKKAKRGAMNFWNNPLTATLFVVGAAIVVGVAIDQWTDDKPSGSVSQSTLGD